MGNNMEIIYKNDKLQIKSYDFVDDFHLDMIDFFILFNNVEYSCSAFSLNYINKLVLEREDNFFWCKSSIIIREGTKDCLVSTILKIIEDKSLCLSEIFLVSEYN